MRPGSRPRREELAAHALAALGYTALTLLFLRPAWRVLGTHISPDPGDPLYLLYVLKWGMHQIRLGLPGFWDAPFFFPARATLTYSEHMLGPALFATLLSWLVPNPIALFNLIFLGAYAATGWTAWYVLRRSGIPGAAAFLGGLMFTFAPFRWSQAPHLQMLLTVWLAPALWTWDRLLERPGGRRAAAFLAVYALHVTGGTYLAYMIHVPLAVIAAVRLPRLWREGRLRAALPWLAGTVAACGLLMLALFLPYLRTARALGLARLPQELQAWGAALPSFLEPAGNNLYGHLFPAQWRRPENDLFAGVLPTALALGALAAGWRRLRRPPARPLPPRRRAILAILAALGLVGWLWGDWKTLAAAKILPEPPAGAGDLYEPVLLVALLGGLALLLRRRWGGNWPLELSRLDPWSRGLALSGALCFLLSFPILFQPLTRVVPGLGGMRVPARFYPFVSFALCYFAARALAALLERLRTPAGRALAAAAVGALLIVDLMPRPLPWVRLRSEAEFPPVYAWLAGRDDIEALLELPLGGETQEIRTMYLGTRHWKPLVNGYSGYFPPFYESLRQTCCHPLPDEEMLPRLRRFGVTHLLVHRATLRARPRDIRQWEAEAPVRLEFAQRGDRVYRILDPGERREPPPRSLRPRRPRRRPPG